MAEKLYTLPQLVPSEQLIKLVPHKSKMFLLDRLTQHDTEARTLESESLVSKDHIFYDKEIDGVPSYVAFEMIAQSISALSGVTGYEIGKPPRPGFLLSLLNYSSKVPFFKAGTSVHVKIKKVDEMQDIMTYSGEAFYSECPNEPVITTIVTVMETDDLKILYTH
ncbi:MAG: 3-hydroxylacyl-ACP dehydratase [Treponema sp.]|nr:3-hydroxylacyl-ACP dehydratase [Treponema sp.]